MHRTVPALLASAIIAQILSRLDARNLLRATLVCEQWSDIVLDMIWQAIHDVPLLTSFLGSMVAIQTSSASLDIHFLNILSRLLHVVQGKSDGSDPFSGPAHASYAWITDRGPDRRQCHESTCSALQRPNGLALSYHAALYSRSITPEQSGPNVCSLPTTSSRHRELKDSPSSFVDATPSHLSCFVADGPTCTAYPFRRRLSLLIDEIMDRVCLTVTVPSSTLTQLSSNIDAIVLACLISGAYRRHGDESSKSFLHSITSSSQNKRLAPIDTIRASCMPAALLSVYSRLLIGVGPQTLQERSFTILTRCGQLTELYIDFLLRSSTSENIVLPLSAPHLDFDTWKPLLACFSLRSIELRWRYELRISNAHLEIISTSWPSMEVLLLNCDPLPGTRSPSLTPLALLPLAKNCRRLKELSLYVDGSKLPAIRSRPAGVFKTLRWLRFGNSPIKDMDPMVLFLSLVCPVGCEVVAGVRSLRAYQYMLDKANITGTVRMKIVSSWLVWTDIGRALPLLVKVRENEKQRMRPFIDEVRQRHQARVGELERELRELKQRRKHKSPI